ncbi:MAG: hypothetical protein EXR71_20545 [Myxococcales bacterium]|nr:hypothetical protein [Myxococcales bacterium]
MILALVAGCQAPTPPGDLVVTLAAGDRPAATATWTPDPDVRTRVELSGPDGPVLATEWHEAGLDAQSASLLGMFPDAEWSASLKLETGETADAATFSTPPLPVDFPSWSLTGTPGWTGWMLVPMLDDAPGVVLMDQAGRVVWFTSLVDVWVGGGRSRVRRDGLGIWMASMGDQPATLTGVSWMGEVLQTVSLDGLNHDYTELSDGRFAWNNFDCRADDTLGRVCGNAIKVGKLSGPTAVVFSTWDEFDPNTDGEVTGEADWTHANALFVEPDEASAWFGLRNFNAILHVDLTTGAVLDQVAGPHATLTPAGPSAHTHEQHRFEVLADGNLVVHDNGTTESNSRVVELALDRAAGTATVVSVLQHDPPVFDYALGDVHRAEDGSTLVTWATAGLIDDFAPDGTLRATISAELGLAFGYNDVVTALPGMVGL